MEEGILYIMPILLVTEKFASRGQKVALHHKANMTGGFHIKPSLFFIYRQSPPCVTNKEIPSPAR